MTRADYVDQIAFLKAVCRIAADRLRDGGTFPINGETWELLDFAAGPSTNAAPLGVAAGEPAQHQPHPAEAAPLQPSAAGEGSTKEKP